MMEYIKKRMRERREEALRERCLRYAIQGGERGSDAVLTARMIHAWIERGEVRFPGYGD